MITSSFRPGNGSEDADANGFAVLYPEVDNGQALSVGAARPKAAKLFQDLIDQEGNGIAELQQYFVFTEARTGATDKDHPFIVKASGYSLTYDVQKGQVGGVDGYFIIVQRSSAANNGASGGKISDADAQPVPIQIK